MKIPNYREEVDFVPIIQNDRNGLFASVFKKFIKIINLSISKMLNIKKNLKLPSIFRNLQPTTCHLKPSKGFTLIELLVVIAIIGILSSVVLASLNSARGKGSNAAIKANLDNMRAQAEIVYDNNSNSYAAVCADANVAKAVLAAATAGGGSVLATNAANTVGNTSCYNAAGSWVVESSLKVAEAGMSYRCVDHTGTAKNTNTLTPANATVCP